MTPEQREELVRLLQQGEELSPEWGRVLFPPEKREYELVYHGKEREEDIIADTLAVPLQPVRTFGGNGPDWHNMLIFGDNLQAMKTLLEMKKTGNLRNPDGTEGVRLVYIDPPFSTKRDFAGTEDQKAYQDKISGSVFLEFIRRRVILLKELLAENGSLFIHLDYRKSHYVKTLLDEIFYSESRFENEIIWHYPDNFQGNVNRFPNNHNVIFLYSKSNLTRFKRVAIELKNGPVKRDVRVWDPATESLTAARDKDGKIIYKTFTHKWADDVWEIGQSSVTKKKSSEFIGYPTQKPEALLRIAIEAASEPGDIVLDAFAGSGTACAVAEKLKRRWIGIDCGKLAIYTIQKRMLNLRREIGNKGPKLTATPFTLYNAGLYDFSQLRSLPWEDWRFFALQLFQCRDEPHKVGGIAFDGFRQGADVMVFNHLQHKDAKISEETIHEIHDAVGSRVGVKVFIIAPALTFDFQQDYIKIDGVRYYALRIPYSIIHELHRREFTALKQPSDEMAVNDTVEAVGFDFIRTPELDYKVGREKPVGELFEQAFIQIKKFRSDAVVREPYQKKGNHETISMVMLDFDYDEKSQVFDLDEVQYADAIEKAGWKVTFRLDLLGKKMMAVFLDIYGNDARVLIEAKAFGKAKTPSAAAKKPVKARRERK